MPPRPSGPKEGDAVAGSIGDLGCLSFYPTKNLSALGDAGACVTHHRELAQRVSAIRVHGATSRYQHQFMGGNFRIDALQAAILGLKLSHIEAWNDLCRDAAKRYDGLLNGLPVTRPVEVPGKHHVYHQYTIRAPDRWRDVVADGLRSAGIACEVYYPTPLHLQPALSDLGYKVGDFPVAEQAAREVLSLPIFPGITPAQQERVVRAIRVHLR